MILQRKGSPMMSDVAVPSAFGNSNGKTAKRRRIFQPTLFMTIVFFLILVGGCLYVGFKFGEIIGEKYLTGFVEEMKPGFVEDEDYTQLLKYPPPPLRRVIRRSPP
jgi:hypothetical protein